MKIYVMQLITGFLGSLGFCVIFNIRRKKLIFASVGGFLSWGIFLLLGLGVSSEPIRYLWTAAAITVYAEIMARAQKTPTTTYLVPSMIPLVPGGMLYRTMRHALSSNFNEFYSSAVYTLALSASLAAGVIIVTSIVSGVSHLKSKAAEKYIQ